MKPLLGITMGDPAGIGPEIIVKSLNLPLIYDICTPVVIGDRQVLANACSYSSVDLQLRPVSNIKEALGEHGTIDYYELGKISQSSVKTGECSAVGGEAAFQYIIKAIDLANENLIDAVVTAPINKEAINLAGYRFAGHTEIFAHYTNAKPGSFAMMLTSGSFRVIHATTHVSIRKACDLITKDRVLATIRLAKQAVELLGVTSPYIGVSGLNPHSSENGLFGDEESNEIIPAIESARAEGIQAEGPVPPDTVFVKALGGKYDIVVAMYHDQGHIPLKLHGFSLSSEKDKKASVSGVNATIGIPIIRTSVDHGTAFDIAGKNIADHQSLVDAIEMAATMASVKLRGRV